MIETSDRLKGTLWDRCELEPRALAFRDGLLTVETGTEQMLRERMAQVPTGIVTALQRGPLPSRFSCRVCDAFGRDWIKDAPCDPQDPLWWVWAFHEVPRLDARHRDAVYYGAIANRIYERTIATYRAAGWEGEAADANA